MTPQKGGMHQATTDFGKTGKAQGTQYPMCGVILGTVSSGETQRGPCAPHEVWKVRVSSVSHPNADKNLNLCWGLAESVWFSVHSSQPVETLSQSSQESYGTTWLQLFPGRTHHSPRWAVGSHDALQGMASRLCPQHSSASFVHTDNM